MRRTFWSDRNVLFPDIRKEDKRVSTRNSIPFLDVCCLAHVGRANGVQIGT